MPETAAQPRISAVIPTLNRRADLLEFAATLIQQTVRCDELVIVDAGDVPDMKEALEAALDGSGCVLKYRKSEAGTSLQRNIALDLVDADYVFLFDDDVLLEPEYIERTLEAFAHSADPPVGCVLGTFLSEPRPQGMRQRYFRAFGMTHAMNGEPSISTSGGVRWPIDPAGVVEIPVASGGRTAYRRDAIGDVKCQTGTAGRIKADIAEASLLHLFDENTLHVAIERLSVHLYHFLN